MSTTEISLDLLEDGLHIAPPTQETLNSTTRALIRALAIAPQVH